MALKDYPEIAKAYAAKEKELAPLLAKIEALREKQAELRAEQAKLQAREAEIVAEIHAIERPKVIEIRKAMSAMARATGDRALSDARS